MSVKVKYKMSMGTLAKMLMKALFMTLNSLAKLFVEMFVKA